MSRRVNNPLLLEFTAERLTSFAGLELLARYLQRIGFNRRLAQRLKGASLPTDFGIVAIASLSFIAPFEPVCLIVYGPGKYRFRDFVAPGAPLTLLVVVLLMILVPVFWPL